MVFDRCLNTEIKAAHTKLKRSGLNMPAIKTVISRGFMNIPVSLYKTTRDISISFNQLCKDTHERVRYKKICPSCNKEVKSEDIIKGYEFEKGRYVTFTEDELEKLKTRKDKTLQIDKFAKMSEVDPIYFDKNYYAVPDAGAEKGYELLRQALITKKEVAIIKTVMGTSEKLMVLYPTKDIMLVKTLFYHEEIQAVPVPLVKPKIEKADLELTKTMIDVMTSPFNPEQYFDDFQSKVREAVETKIEGKEIETADTTTGGFNNVVDIMVGIKKTIDMEKKGTA